MEIIAKWNNVDVLKMKKDRLILSASLCQHIASIYFLINLLVHVIFQ